MKQFINKAAVWLRKALIVISVLAGSAGACLLGAWTAVYMITNFGWAFTVMAGVIVVQCLVIGVIGVFALVLVIIVHMAVDMPNGYEFALARAKARAELMRQVAEDRTLMHLHALHQVMHVGALLLQSKGKHDGPRQVAQARDEAVLIVLQNLASAIAVDRRLDKSSWDEQMLDRVFQCGHISHDNLHELLWDAMRYREDDFTAVVSQLPPDVADYIKERAMVLRTMGTDGIEH
jgi:hypothetical protein